MPLVRLIISVFAFACAASAGTSSCGGAPPIEFLDTLDDGGIVYREYSRGTYTSYPAQLRNAVNALFEKEKNIAVATVNGTCRKPSFELSCNPGFCYFTVSIDTVLKGKVDKREFNQGVSFGCGIDNPDAYLEGKRFLIYSDTTPFSRMTAGGPCYSHPRGFFIEDGNIVSPMTAVGQKLPIETLKAYPVGLKPPASDPMPRKRGKSYRVDGRDASASGTTDAIGVKTFKATP